MRTLVTGLFLALAACGASAADQLADAESKLAARDFAGASAAAAEGLAASADPATAWRLELVGLESQSRAGQADPAKATIERLAVAHPEQVKAALYVATANQLTEAGQGAGAVAVLDAGLQRFPGDADLAKAIEAAKSSGGADQLEALKSLGYIQ